MLFVSKLRFVGKKLCWSDFHMFSLSWCTISNAFSENIDMAIFPFPFQIFIPLANLWFIRLQGEFPILRTWSCSDLYLRILHPSKAICTWKRENPYLGIHSVPSYIGHLQRCSHCPARRLLFLFYLFEAMCYTRISLHPQILAAMTITENVWVLYFLIYSRLTLSIIWIISPLQISFINQTYIYIYWKWTEISL